MKGKRLLVLLLSVVMTLCMIPSLAFAGVDDEAVWTTEHFTYSGTTVTGFSDAGKALVATTNDVVIPDKTPDGEAVTAIGDKAFAGAYDAKSPMTSVVIPSTVESIGTTAFTNTMLKSVSIPDSVTTLGMGTFSNSAELKSVKLSKNAAVIPQSAFAMCAIESIEIPEGVTEVQQSAFAGNYSTSLSLPSTLKTIGKLAFQNVAISELATPASVETIGPSAFYASNSTTKIEKLVLNEGLTTIDSTAFRKNKITEVVLPSTVTTLAKNAFQDNTSTVKVYYKDAAQAKFGTQTGVKGMELISIENALEQEKENNTALKNENESLKSENESLKSENESLKAENESLKAENGELKEDNENLKKENDELKGDNDSLNADNGSLKTENDDLKNENAELQKQLEIATAKAEMLLKSINTSASSVNYNTIKLSFSAEDVEGFVVDGEDVGNVSSRTFTGLVTGRASSHTVKAYITVNEERVFTREFKVSATPKLNTPAVKVSGAKKRVTSSWGKISGASRYQVSVSTSRAKTSIKYTGAALKYTKKSLKSKKTYYVKVRAYRTVAGKKVYGSWSAVKAVKTK